MISCACGQSVIIPVMPAIIPMGMLGPCVEDDELAASLSVVGDDVDEDGAKVGSANAEVDRGGSSCTATDAAVVAERASGEICAGPRTWDDPGLAADWDAKGSGNGSNAADGDGTDEGAIDRALSVLGPGRSPLGLLEGTDGDEVAACGAGGGGLGRGGGGF